MRFGTIQGRAKRLRAEVFFDQIVLLQSLTLSGDTDPTLIASRLLYKLVPPFIAQQLTPLQLLLFCEELVSLPS